MLGFANSEKLPYPRCTPTARCPALRHNIGLRFDRCSATYEVFGSFRTATRMAPAAPQQLHSMSVDASARNALGDTRQFSMADRTP